MTVAFERWVNFVYEGVCWDAFLGNLYWRRLMLFSSGIWVVGPIHLYGKDEDASRSREKA
jgi:hypothetical protein